MTITIPFDAFTIHNTDMVRVHWSDVSAALGLPVPRDAGLARGFLIRSGAPAWVWECAHAHLDDDTVTFYQLRHGLPEKGPASLPHS